MTTAFRCPECGGPIDLQTNVTVGERYVPTYHVRGAESLVRERVAAAVGFCTECEFAVEVTARVGEAVSATTKGVGA